ncbi:fungal-specific transcription factor domain-containing protein [Aspergillus pseudoustus]|uniref:Fungal-specific transcription factor domain-containing protein n=1 Tax=Aspergillus pseudoustus TaxID=1810923 RepID=A0ABR4IZF5_9EURO
MADDYTPPALRASVACVACNKKKVRCTYDENSHKCRNCLRHRWPCFQRQPKRRGRHPGSGSRRDNRPERRNGTAPTGIQSSPLSESRQEATPPITWSDNTAETLEELSSWSFPGSTKENTNPYTSVTADCGFMERNDYFRDADSIHDVSLQIPPAEIPTGDDAQLLRMQRAFDMPPRAVRDSLIDIFMNRCAPWMPIVERSWLQETGSNRPSILLLQSVFLAASRVTSAPAVTAYATSHEFYRRAKALFWSGWEKNPLTVIAAVCILHWYNPECPEHVSTNTSGFWRYVGVGLAHQIGLQKEPVSPDGRALRRRLWWSLFARDCLISAGQGRPLAVNLGDCELKPPCMEDFRGSSHRPELFIAYVEICSILGHLTQCCRRDSLTRRTRQSVCRSLQRWIQGLPQSLRLFADSGLQEGDDLGKKHVLLPYDFEARQLHVPYFICLIILCRAPSPQHPPSATAILASSHIVAIFEDFLARNELQFLGSIFTFYLLAAGLGLLSCRRVPVLWSKAAANMGTLYASLEQLAKRWPSAMAPLRVLRNISPETGGASSTSPQVPKLADDHIPFFNTLGPGLTWAWEEFMPQEPHVQESYRSNIGDHGHSSSVDVTALASTRAEQTTSFPMDTTADSLLVPPLGDFTGMNYHQGAADDGLPQLQYEGIGDWLLNDFDVFGELTF